MAIEIKETVGVKPKFTKDKKKKRKNTTKEAMPDRGNHNIQK